MGEETTTETAKKKRKGTGKLPLIIGAIVIVIGAGAAGFAVWHSQPTFCNAVCHSPMDSYVDNYYGDADTYLSAAHAEAGITCLDCHEPTLQQQIQEAITWISGDFKDPLSRTRIGTKAFCSTCHDDDDPTTGIDWEDIQTATANWNGTGRNPHDSHMGAMECNTCHSVHRTPTMTLYCTSCHPTMQ